MTNKQAIELQDVVKRYGSNMVVDHVNLSVADGECLLLAGHNGAGKTTLMKLMLGLTRADGGVIRVLGEDPASASSVARRGRLGFLPEIVAFQGAMTGREVMHFYAKLNGDSLSQCSELLERVGLQDAADRRVQTYSKGMRQRLGLAQALLGDPGLLLLDEPTTGLDPSLRQHFFNIIGEMQGQGITTLISSHALNAFEARVNRVAIMKHGRLLACGSMAALSRQAALSVKVKISVAPGQATQLAERLGSNSGICHVNEQSVKLECLSADKMAIVRRIAELGEAVLDVDIRSPRLDEIYDYYMQDKQAERAS